MTKELSKILSYDIDDEEEFYITYILIDILKIRNNIIDNFSGNYNLNSLEQVKKISELDYDDKFLINTILQIKSLENDQQ